MSSRSKISIWATRILGFVAGVLTITAFYELLTKDRYVPYYVTTMEICGDKAALKSDLSDFGNLVYDNVGGTIFIDFDLLFYCENEDVFDRETIFEVVSEVSTTSIHDDAQKLTFMLEPTRRNAPQVELVINRGHLEAEPLSRVQPGLTEYSGDRVLGLFFLRGNLEAGIYSVDLFPVPYSDELQGKFSCSKALGDTNDWYSWMNAYVSSCILRLDQPDWSSFQET
ncbi:hypothetical protein [Pseudovibrio ascidiaceicola]|uniref:hypothetical protein n=1 Tax=Pseudovibrio ascidiaceicola TaxID=285279 RepID=UPI000D685470|nr:hypothetical protein [Pseudovibrio ascidiaceicola]